ncbi:hypothetical protein [Kribbella speibonae]|uniref:Uncharacterized protein n=1 Tax=Kribbella speibonae TaxID=1572660 RepID=A0A4R0IID9_9ACTN|nr:hypothetical protein [Kribbella speibonae]TCC30828.1 hypothetical protein E0H92_37595 [Kribbella speibonae]
MSFEAKRLRVEVPWEGDGELAAADEPIIKGQCLDWASNVVGSCLDFFTTALLVKGAFAFDAGQIPAMRAQLEERLSQLDEAERGNLAPGSDRG